MTRATSSTRPVRKSAVSPPPHPWPPCPTRTPPRASRSGRSFGAGVAITADSRGVTYAPQAGFVGTDSFTYTVSDGHGGTATGRVTVLVSNPPGSGLVATLGTPGQDGQHSTMGTAVAASDAWVL